jgi:hypothetical protein
MLNHSIMHESTVLRKVWMDNDPGNIFSGILLML